MAMSRKREVGRIFELGEKYTGDDDSQVHESSLGRDEFCIGWRPDDFQIRVRNNGGFSRGTSTVDLQVIIDDEQVKGDEICLIKAQ